MKERLINYQYKVKQCSKVELTDTIESAQKRYLQIIVAVATTYYSMGRRLCTLICAMFFCIFN